MKNENLGARLRQLRHKNSMTIVEFAEKIEVPASTYAEWENGRLIQGEPCSSEMSNIMNFGVSSQILND